MTRTTIFTRRLAAYLTLAVALSPSGALAQRYLGSIAGEVSDATGAKIPAATVTAEERTPITRKRWPRTAQARTALRT